MLSVVVAGEWLGNLVPADDEITGEEALVDAGANLATLILPKSKSRYPT